MIEVTLAPEVWKDVDADVEALLDAWQVAEGDTVRAGQPLANVVVVKANVEVSAPAAGRVASILVAAGETFGRGKPIATIEEDR